MKRTAIAGGLPTVETKRGAKPRSDEQEPDARRRRVGCADQRPHSHLGDARATTLAAQHRAAQEEKVATLEARPGRKDSVIAEISIEYVSLGSA